MNNTVQDLAEFPATPEGLQMAIEWASKQPHSYLPNMTLLDELYKLDEDGYSNIHKINQAYKNLNK